MIIREEQPQEYRAIYELVKTAFKTARVSDGKEQDFVNRLRSAPTDLHLIP
jgi:putative acetyltransferase